MALSSTAVGKKCCMEPWTQKLEDTLTGSLAVLGLLSTIFFIALIGCEGVGC